jgi:hypothetical protein
MRRVSENSLRWSVNHIVREGDTDLFPRPFEIDIIAKNIDSVVTHLKDIDITEYYWQGARSLLIPKEQFFFRRVCQLDPIDTVLFTAIVKEIGSDIEKSRQSMSESRVFSYRFDPTAQYRLYGDASFWEDFWKTSIERARSHTHVVLADISDFYNQIYHHTIKNQLDECGIDTSYSKAIDHLLDNISQGKSRGIPVGPHASHALAELSLIPVDDFLVLKGYNFCRFSDDMHMFCNSLNEARIAIYELADILDKNQKLLLSRHKTKVLGKDEFLAYANSMLIDNPINRDEAELLKVIRSRVDNPYAVISLSDLSEEDLKKFSKKKIENVLQCYVAQENPNYVRLRWFLRRLSQTGIPTGVEFTVSNIESLTPAIGDAANYLKSAQKTYKGSWNNIGIKLLTTLGLPIVQKNEYLQVVILSLFSRITDLDNVDRLIQEFDHYGSLARRKVVLAATAARATSWLRGFKEGYSTLDPWLKRAVIYAAQTLPADEKKHWLKRVKRNATYLEQLAIDSI